MSASATVNGSCPLGFLGLGDMGGPMVRHLLRAGFPVTAFDLKAERLEAARAEGVVAAPGAGDVVPGSRFILTSLPSSAAFCQVAEEVLLPRLESGQTVIDLGTTTPPEARRLAARFRERGAELVEAPVSGGPGGAERADLLMFVGGSPEAVERVRPVLETLTRPERIAYCGPSGSGQAVKGVNQLMMGLGAAAYLEAMAFGVRAGVDPEVILRAVAPDPPFPGAWRSDFGKVAARVVEGQGETVGVKFRELPYFIQEAEAAGFLLPLTRTLYEFCEAGPRVVIDDHRPAPSFWRELSEVRPDRTPAGEAPPEGSAR